MNFYIGQKVVCVIDAPISHSGCDVKSGVVYTVSGIIPQRNSLLLAEVVSVYNPLGDFLAIRFRPIEEASLTASLAQTESERWVTERPEHVNEPQHA